MSENVSLNVLALIPAFNEGYRAAVVAQAVQAYLPVLVIDDGSTDNTASQVVSTGVEILRQWPNQGKGAALLAGFNRAIKDGYDAVITLDADGQHDPCEIPEFLQTFQENKADLIIGKRDFTQMPTVRRISNTLGTQIFSWALGQPIYDNQSGYRLISRRLMEDLQAPVERGFEFEVEMIVKCVLHGYKMSWIPIKTIYGDEKSHIHPFRHTYKFFQVSLRARHLIREAWSK